MAKKKLSKTEEITEAADKVVAFWMDYRKFFRKAFVTQAITAEEEQGFLKTKSEVTRMQRVLHQRLARPPIRELAGGSIRERGQAAGSDDGE